MAIYSGFTHKQWWFSIVMLVYQRVTIPNPYLLATQPLLLVRLTWKYAILLQLLQTWSGHPGRKKCRLSAFWWFWNSDHTTENFTLRRDPQNVAARSHWSHQPSSHSFAVSLEAPCCPGDGGIGGAGDDLIYRSCQACELRAGPMETSNQKYPKC